MYLQCCGCNALENKRSSASWASLVWGLVVEVFSRGRPWNPMLSRKSWRPGVLLDLLSSHGVMQSAGTLFYTACRHL